MDRNWYIWPTLLLIFLTLVIFFCIGLGDNDEGECVKIQTTCCGCNMGGEEKCVLKDEVGDYEKNLSGCSPTVLCSAVFNCEINSCEYVGEECVAR